MHGDQNDAREVLRYQCGGLAALFGQQVMSFVQDDPMRASGLGPKLLQFGKQFRKKNRSIRERKSQQIDDQR